MTSPRSSSSIKNAIILMVMLISSLSLISAFLVNGWVEVKQQKEALNKEINTIADIMSFSSADILKNGDPSVASDKLSNLNIVNIVDNLHIYRIDDFSGELEFFASYNKQGTPPVPAKFAQIDSLKKMKFSDYHVELTKTIKIKGKVIGYLYIRASLERLNSRINNSLYINLATLLCSLLISFLLALRFQRQITKPIQTLLSLFKQVARQKDYSVRAPKTSLHELAALSLSFNTMLDRIEASMQKQQKAEKEILKLNQNLEDKVGQRTTALKESNSELMSTLEKLHQYQNQLVENEKMASLGDMVAGIAHEVNTPIGLGVTASTLMMDKLKGIQQLMEVDPETKRPQLKPQHLKKFLNESDENLNIIYRNLNRAAELISSFKQVAVDQSSETDRQFVISKFISEVLLSLRPKLKNLKHNIKIECEETLQVESKPGPLNQILINLIMNSIIHGFEFIEEGTISIKIRTVNDDLCISYKDNGKGISEQLRKRIFDPFVTTKRGEGGSGLGMHLVYNLITQALKGTITVASEEGKGIHFEISLPVKIIKLK